ncbi:MAG TPA: hypothetical protein VNA13_00385 [Xanthomonadales bacterium]|nr:hypothetical protein [Xanthomonadales bacterium]
MILTYETKSTIIIFEFEELLPNGLIKAANRLDSQHLETGEYTEPFFKKEEVREASGDEVEYYNYLRQISPYKSEKINET